MRRTLSLSSLSALSALALFGLSHVVGCGTTAPAEDNVTTEGDAVAALAACGLDDGSIDVHAAKLHACDPQDTKKTTICHIPPGNPANAHTICVGNAAVPAHLHNHGDGIGACVVETKCPPPSTGAGGAPGGSTGGGSGGAPAADAGVVIVP
jgi:hypothetical protein